MKKLFAFLRSKAFVFGAAALFLLRSTRHSARSTAKKNSIRPITSAGVIR